MQNAEALTGQQIAEFLKGSEGIAFCGADRASIYQWTEELLVAQEYGCKGKKERGAIRKYACKVTGLSLPQMTRLIRSRTQTGFTWFLSAPNAGYLGWIEASDRRVPGLGSRTTSRSWM